jgi:hypothetical protein
LEWGANSGGIRGVEASEVIGYNCRFAVDLSAHPSIVDDVMVSGVTAHSCDQGVHATNAAGYADAGGGSVSATITGGCIHAGDRSQKTTGPASWNTVHSEYVTEVVDITGANAVQVTFDHLGYTGRFTKSTAGGDPSVTC